MLTKWAWARRGAPASLPYGPYRSALWPVLQPRRGRFAGPSGLRRKWLRARPYAGAVVAVALLYTAGGAVMAAAAASQAKVVYVAPGGSDANEGTAGRPLATLAAAQRLMAAGDTAYFRGGTYRITGGDVMGVEENIYATVFNISKGGREGGAHRVCRHAEQLHSLLKQV